MSQLRAKQMLRFPVFQEGRIFVESLRSILVVDWCYEFEISEAGMP